MRADPRYARDCRGAGFARYRHGVEVDHPKRGKFLTVGNPIKLSDSPTEVKRSPLLGEHTGEILESVLGLDDDEIEEAQNEGAI